MSKGKYHEKGLAMMFLTRKESNGPKMGPITAKNVPKAAAKIEGFFFIKADGGDDDVGKRALIRVLCRPAHPQSTSGCSM